MPEPVYPCACHDCAVEVSYSANMLAWCRDGFYCDECIGEMDSERDDDEDHTVTIGPDLADVLAQAPAAVPVEAPAAAVPGRHAMIAIAALALTVLRVAGWPDVSALTTRR